MRSLAMKGFRKLAVLALAAVLGACSYMPQIEGQKIDYKSAGQVPPLEIPPDLTRPQTDDRFVVPGQKPPGAATASDYERAQQGRPATAAVVARPEGVRMERSGTQRWLVVRGSPDRVWPLVKDFWLEQGFILEVEQPQYGVMETDWAENRAKVGDLGLIRNLLGKLLDSTYATGERDKFRTRIEPGQEPETTDIFISNRRMEEVPTGRNDTGDTNFMWSPRPADPEVEAIMLQRLMVRLGADEKTAKAQVATPAAKAPARAALAKGGNGTVLTVNDQFDRAWRRVGLALDRVGFTVEDRNRAEGLYFVRYADSDASAPKQQDTGWLSKLKFWDSGPKDLKSEQYRIRVKETAVDAASEVSVLTKDGAPDRSETANRILGLLFEQLK